MTKLPNKVNSVKKLAKLAYTQRRQLTFLASLSFLLQAFSLPVCAQVAPVHSAVISHSVHSSTSGQASKSSQSTTLTSAQLNSMIKSGAHNIILNANNYSGNLTIPKGITLVDVVAKNASSFNISGNLVDSGRLVFRTADASLLSASLSARNITVNPGASIASLGSLSLNINAVSNISNAGTISSAANLNILAGGTITNSLPSASHATQPVIQAQNNISMSAGSGVINNSGLISAINGSVNVSSMTANQSLNNSTNLLNSTLSPDLTVNGTSGAISALKGGINALASEGNLALTGGDYLSQTLNLTADNTISTSLGNVSGVVNAQACNIHVFANSPNLQIGKYLSSGDPIMANTGDINLSAALLTSGAPLILVSGKNITSTSAFSGNIDTSSSSGNGGNLYLIAGATFTPNPYPQAAIPLPAITITGASATGGKIDLTAGTVTGIKTTANPVGNFNGGNVEISAFAGSALGSGTINIPISGAFATSGSLGGSGSAGHVLVVAGASTNVSGTPSISIPGITASGGAGVGASGLAGGHVVVATEQPNVSATKPMMIDPNDGAILQGGILGGPLANSPVIIKGDILTGGQVLVIAGMGITANNITTNTNSNAPSGAIVLLAGATGKNPTSSNISAMALTTGTTSASNSGKVELIAGGNIDLTGQINTSAAGAGNANGGDVFIAAGTPTSQGNISLSGVSTAVNSGSGNSGAIAILSAGGSNNQGISSSGPLDSSNSSAVQGESGPITISTPGSITLPSITTRNFAPSGNGGSVFISSGDPTLGSLNITSITTSTNDAQLAGGVYLFTAATFATPTITQVQLSGTANKIIVMAPSTTTSIAGNAGTINISLNGNVGPTTFNPGGYLSINDQTGTKKGGAIISLIVQNDPNVVVPIVSLSSSPLTLTGSTTSFSGIETNLSGNSSILLFSPGGINISGANTFIASSNAATVSITLVATTAGNVVLSNNSAFSSSLTVGTALSNSGTISLATRSGLTVGAVSSGATPTTGNSITLDALGLFNLNLTDSLNAAAGIALSPTSTGNILESIPSVIDGGALTIGNANLLGNIGSASNPIFPDLPRVKINTNPNVGGNGVFVSSVSDITLTFTIGGALDLTGNNAILLDNTVPNSAGAQVIMQVGSIRALKSGPAILSPGQQLQTTQTQGIGSSSIPLNIANLKGATGAIRLITTAGTGSIFLASTATNDVQLLNTTVNASTFSLNTTGNIILNAGLVVNATTINLSSKAGIQENGGTASLLSTGALNLAAGTQGISVTGTTNGSLLVSSTALNLKTTGSAVLFASTDLTFAGASTVGGTTGVFSLFPQNNNVTFANLSSLTAPTVFIQGISGTGGTLTQATAGAISILSASTNLANMTVGVGVGAGVGKTQFGIKGGNLEVSTTDPVNLLSANSVSFNGASTASSFALEVKTGGVSQVLSASQLDLLSNTIVIQTDGVGDIGSSTKSITVDTGFNTTSVALTVNSLQGNAFVTGVPDPSTNASTGLNIGSSSAKLAFSLTTSSPIQFVSTNATAITGTKSVSVTSSGTFSLTGLNQSIVSPSILLNGNGGAGTLLLSNVPGAPNTPINLTVQEFGNTSIQAPAINLSGASMSGNAAHIQLKSIVGAVTIGSGASFKTTDATLTDLKITSATTINQAVKATTLVATSIELIATGMTGSIGSAAVSVGTSSGTVVTLNLTAQAANNVFISNDGPVSLLANPSATSFQLTTTGQADFGTIKVSTPLNATNVVLQTSSASIFLNSPINCLGGTLTLNAGGAGSIGGTGVLTAQNLVLSTNSGSIGFSGPSGALTTVVDKFITAKVATGNTGIVNISNTGLVVTLNSSSAGGGFTFINAGSLTINSIATRAPLNLNTGSILVATTGSGVNLNVARAAVVSAVGGSITLQDDSSSGGAIDIKNGARISTLAAGASNGTVVILYGAALGSLQTGQTPLPAGLSLGKSTVGGTYSLGETNGSSVVVHGTGNVLNLVGQSIFFDTGVGGPPNITLEGGVIITADPVNLSAPSVAPQAVANLGVAGLHLSTGTMSESSVPQLSSIELNPSLTTTSGVSANNVSANNVAANSVAANSVLGNNVLGNNVFGNNVLTNNVPTNLFANSHLVPSSYLQEITGFDISQTGNAYFDKGSHVGPARFGLTYRDTQKKQRLNGASSVESGESLRPISFTECVGVDSRLNVQRAETTEATIFCEGNASLVSENGGIALLHGRVLLLPKTKTKLMIGTTECTIEKGCAVLASRDGENIELVNVADKQNGQVRVKQQADSKVFSLEIGKEIVLGKTTEFSFKLPIRNEIRSAGLVAANVSVPFVLSTALAKGLLASSLEEDKQVSKQLLKSSAAFALLNSRQAYRPLSAW